MDGASLAGPITSLSVVPLSPMVISQTHLASDGELRSRRSFGVSGTQPGLQTEEVSGGSGRPKPLGPHPRRSWVSLPPNHRAGSKDRLGGPCSGKRFRGDCSAFGDLATKVGHRGEKKWLKKRRNLFLEAGLSAGWELSVPGGSSRNPPFSALASPKLSGPWAPAANVSSR